MSDALPDYVTRTEVEAIAADAVADLRRELRGAHAPTLTSSTPTLAAPVTGEAAGEAVASVVLEAMVLKRGDGSAGEFLTAVNNLFGRHASIVLAAFRRITPQIVKTEQATS